MSNSKELVYSAIHCLERLGKHLSLQGILQEKSLLDFLEHVKSDSLYENFSFYKQQAKSINKLLLKKVVDEQGASFEQMMQNMYCYAYSTFLSYFIEEDRDFLAGTLECALELYEFEATDIYLKENYGTQAVILTMQDIEKINQSALIKAELHAQGQNNGER